MIGSEELRGTAGHLHDANICGFVPTKNFPQTLDNDKNVNTIKHITNHHRSDSMRTHMEPIKPEDFTRIKNDVNGNPRHVCHFLHLDVHGWESNIGLSERYALAVKLANTIGGKKFHNKQYGGGIVFQEYAGCLQSLCDRINQRINATEGETA